MKREIKFRAWNGKFMEIRNFNLVWNKKKEEHEHPLKYPLMQFTYLKDKNGKEIYEGDIVKIHDLTGIINDFIAEICWSKKELSWAFKEGIQWQRPTESVWAWIKEKELEVIGNIYENKELLD